MQRINTPPAIELPSSFAPNSIATGPQMFDQSVIDSREPLTLAACCMSTSLATSIISAGACIAGLPVGFGFCFGAHNTTLGVLLGVSLCGAGGIGLTTAWGMAALGTHLEDNRPLASVEMNAHVPPAWQEIEPPVHEVVPPVQWPASSSTDESTRRDPTAGAASPERREMTYAVEQPDGSIEVATFQPVPQAWPFDSEISPPH